MEIMEIVLLAAGGIIFILSFFIPDKKNVSDKGSTESARLLAEGELKGLVSQELESIRTHVDDVVQEAVTYAVEKTERSLERLSNEKIMAVSEYSDTVLAEIHKNHEEAMFLYDMLNNKHTNLKNTVSEVNRTVKEAEAAVMSFQKLAPETLAASEQRVLSRLAEPPVQREPFRLPQESYGMERAGIEKAGMGRAGNDRLGTMQTVNPEIERAGEKQTGAEWFGTGNFGLEHYGAENNWTGYSETENYGAAGSETGDPGAVNFGIGNPGIDSSAIQNDRIEKIIQQTITEKSGLEMLGAPPESMSLEKAGFTQDVDGQGRNNNDKILELYQQGRSTVAIAKELGLGVGEVKLVIDLLTNQ